MCNCKFSSIWIWIQRCLIHSNFMPFFFLKFMVILWLLYDPTSALLLYPTATEQSCLSCFLNMEFEASIWWVVKHCLAIGEYCKMMETEQPSVYACLEGLIVGLLVYLVVKVLLCVFCLFWWIWLRTVTRVEKSILAQFGTVYLIE